jgi:prepilin-type N-terminal cleavage/methylation domain-containing protein
MTEKKQFVKKRSTERGFTILEVMIAIVVMTIGLLAVMASFAVAITATASAEEDLIARHKALDIMESIYTARNSQQLPFSSINNTTANPPGIFVPGALPLLCAGPDGIVGTADDVACNSVDTGTACPDRVECQVLPGADGVLGTADDITLSLNNFTRSITFNPVTQTVNGVTSTNGNLIGVTVTVAYTKVGAPGRAYTVNGLISSYH